MGEIKSTNGKVPVFGMQPGEIKITKEDYGSEVKRPWQQMKIAMFLCSAVYLVITVTLLLILATRTLPAVLVVAVGFYVCRKLWRVLEGNWFIVLLLSSIFLALAFATIPLSAKANLLVWLLRLWRYWLPFWAIGLLLITFIPALGASLYRFFAEMIDSSGPTAPRAAVAWPGVIWPGMAGRIYKMMNPPKPPDEPEVPEVIERLQVEIVRRADNGQPVSVSLMDFLTGPDAIRRGRDLARRLAAGASLSQRSISGQGRPLSGRAEWEKFMRRMISRGLAEWNDPRETRQGAALTEEGRRVVESIAGSNGRPPHPTTEVVRERAEAAHDTHTHDTRTIGVEVGGSDGLAGMGEEA